MSFKNPNKLKKKKPKPVAIVNKTKAAKAGGKIKK